MMAFLLRWIVAPIVIFAAGLGIGYRLTSDHYKAAEVKQIVRVVHVVDKQGQINTQTAAAVQKAHDRVVYRTQTLTKEIHDAVPAASDFVLPNGWVRIHDGAVGVPAVSDGAWRVDAAPSPFKASDGLAVVVANYGLANDCRAVVQGWQDWYTQQKAAFSAR